MFSGLLVCGECGGGYTVVGKDRYGCAAHRSKGTCDNGRTIKRQEIEGRVIAGLKDKLMAPALVEEFVEEFQREINRVNRDAERQVASLGHELTAVGRKIEAMLRAIEDGMYNPAMKARMAELEERQRDIENRLAAESPSPVRIHAKLPEVYRDKVARLEDALYEPDTKAEAMDIIRGLVDRIVLRPAPEGMLAELHGDLAQILAFCEGADGKNKLPASEETGSQLSVVAGARNPLYRTFLVWVSPYRYRPR